MDCASATVLGLTEWISIRSATHGDCVIIVLGENDGSGIQRDAYRRVVPVDPRD